MRARVVIIVLVLGIGFVAPAVALALWCVWLFRRADTAVEPWQPSTALVTSGPYRFSRNPIYLALVVAFAGFIHYHRDG